MTGQIKHARDMTAAEFAQAKRQLSSQAFRQHVARTEEAAIADLRRRHPDIAAAADERAKAAHADLVRALHQAEAGLREARAETPDIASPLLKQRATDRLRDASEAHDAALLAVESSRAAIPSDVT